MNPRRIAKTTLIVVGLFLIATALVGAGTRIGQEPVAGNSWSKTTGNSWTFAGQS